MRRVVGSVAACPAFRRASRCPAAVVSAKLRRLEVGHSQPARRLAVDARREHDAVLQALVFVAFGASPAESVGEHARKHRCRRKAPYDAEIVDGLPAESHERRFETDDEMLH